MPDNLNKKVEAHEEQINVIALTVIGHTERLDRIEEKLDAVVEKQDVMMDALQEVLQLTRKKDDELTFMGERVKRVEKDVQQIRPLVGLA